MKSLYNKILESLLNDEKSVIDNNFLEFTQDEIFFIKDILDFILDYDDPENSLEGSFYTAEDFDLCRSIIYNIRDKKQLHKKQLIFLKDELKNECGRLEDSEYEDDIAIIEQIINKINKLLTVVKESLLNNEEDIINKKYLYYPKTNEELRSIIKKEIEKHKDKDIINLNMIDTSKITDMQGLFYKCIYNFNISEWNVSNVKNMRNIFCYCYKFNSDLSKWDVSNVEDMSYMFDGCENFNSDLSKWDVSNVEDMSYMFDGCENFNSDLSKWDVHNVEDMTGMFQDCKKFNSDLSNWDVHKVYYTSSMFQYCEKFNSDLSKWDVSNVKDMGSMFNECYDFNCDLSKWDVHNVKDMCYMFNKCIQFNSDLSKWDTHNLKYMSSMFNGCTSLKKLPDWYNR